jgi:hypothetical protein
MNLKPLLLSAAMLAVAVSPAPGQNALDELEVIRSAHKTDRKPAVAEAMQLTEEESVAFWPLYREYRAAMDKIGDGLVKLVLEYADAYPDVPEERAKRLLKDYTALEEDFTDRRTSYLKKFGRILPAAKALRFAQIENRLDLAVRLQLAGAVPLAPAKKAK